MAIPVLRRRKICRRAVQLRPASACPSQLGHENNNIGQATDETPEWAAEGIKKIVQTIHEKLPNTKVLLLGVFPRAIKDSPLRAKVVEINKIIAKLDDGKKTRYLDIGSKFLDENGEIPANVMPDKLHPSPKGYAIWYDAMSPLLKEMLGK